MEYSITIQYISPTVTRLEFILDGFGPHEHDKVLKNVRLLGPQFRESTATIKIESKNHEVYEYLVKGPGTYRAILREDMTVVHAGKSEVITTNEEGNCIDFWHEI